MNNTYYSKTRIFSQRPKGNTRCVAKETYILEKCKNKNVLHVGCSSWPSTEYEIQTNLLLHKKIECVASTVWGIDISEEGISCLRNYGIETVSIGNAENLPMDRQYDVIVAGDVLEHLSNPGLFLDGVQKITVPSASLIVTAPNAFTLSRSLKHWFGGKEIVHEEHTCYFSAKTLAALCARYDFLPTDLRYVSNANRTLCATIKRSFQSVCPMAASQLLMTFMKSDDVPPLPYYEI